MSENGGRRHVGLVVFDDFELLDVFGPAELFGIAWRRFTIELVGPAAGPVKSAQGPRVVAERGFRDVDSLDVVLVPGGVGTRRLVDDNNILGWLAAVGAGAQYVLSVCTGTALLARAGLLEGRRATSNKWSFDWVASQGPGVEWVRRARWVEDGRFWTSSGVSAGMDMTMALIAHLHGDAVARNIANAAEYTAHTDRERDPFADVPPPDRRDG